MTVKPDSPQFYVDASGKHRWRLTGANGEVFGASHQGFATKAKAKANYRLVQGAHSI